MEFLRAKDLENTKQLQKLYEISKLSEQSFNKQSLSMESSQIKLARVNPYENGSFSGQTKLFVPFYTIAYAKNEPKKQSLHINNPSRPITNPGIRRLFSFKKIKRASQT
jgi:hypothetical protein